MPANKRWATSTERHIWDDFKYAVAVINYTTKLLHYSSPRPTSCPPVCHGSFTLGGVGVKFGVENWVFSYYCTGESYDYCRVAMVCPTARGRSQWAFDALQALMGPGARLKPKNSFPLTLRTNRNWIHGSLLSNRGLVHIDYREKNNRLRFEFLEEVLLPPWYRNEQQVQNRTAFCD